jgi:hypothetical protein
MFMVMSVWAAPPVFLPAPALGFITTDEDLSVNTASDQKPDIALDLPTAALAGDVLRVQINNVDAGTRTLTSGDIADPFVPLTASSPGVGTHTMRCRLERGVSESAWSNSLSFQILAAPTVGCTFIGNSAYTGAGQTTHTFTGIGCGTADASRVVALAISQRGTNTFVTGVTINGAAATLAARSPNDPEIAADIWYALVPTGTTCDVVVTTNAAVTPLVVGVHRILTSHPDPVYDVEGYSAVSADAGAGKSMAVTVPAGGIGLALYRTRVSLSPVTVTWTNATVLAGSTADFGSQTTVSTATFTSSATISAVPASNPNRSALATAVWRA